MDFYNGQISYDGLDTIEIPAVDKKAATSLFSTVMIAIVLAMVILIKFGGAPKPVILPVVFMALMFCVFFLGKRIVFLLCKNKKVILQFDPENFTFNGETVKWADMQKITYREFTGKGRGRAGASYYIRIYCGKEFVEITGNTVLKISSKEAAKLIADKFYRYYGFSHGVMLEKSFFSGNYKLTPASQKDVLQKDTAQSTDSPAGTPKMFR